MKKLLIKTQYAYLIIKFILNNIIYGVFDSHMPNNFLIFKNKKNKKFNLK